MKTLDRNMGARSRREFGGKGESGQALVLLALFMIGLLAVMALVLDGGNMYLQRRRMQNAADAGALAGTRILSKNGTAAQAETEAQGYASQHNGADSAAVDATSLPRSVSVVACKNTPMTFAQVIGLRSATVCARARAAWSPVCDLEGVRPIAIWSQEADGWPFDRFSTYQIWDDDKVHSSTEPGWIPLPTRGWLNMDCLLPASCSGAGASELAEWMRVGHPASINTSIFGKKGVVASLLKEAVVGTKIPIVVYDTIQCDEADKDQNGECKQGYYHVLTFAAFTIVAKDSTGAPKWIAGSFQYEAISVPPDPNCTDSDWRTVYLTE